MCIRIVADIGGTNARFAQLQADGELASSITLQCADYAGPEAAVRAYLDQAGLMGIDELAMAVATPVHGDRITWTNRRDWSFSIEDLKQRLGLIRFEVVNDFAALALALPKLAASELRPLGGDAPVPGAARAVIGPGTGLGVSGLVAGRRMWVPLNSEGGHVRINPVDARERAVVEALAAKHGRVSTERVLTGSGLVNLYQGLTELDGAVTHLDTPAAISDSALARRDSHAIEALTMFCRMLGTTASNLALTLGARGGVYIGGGIVPRLGDFFAASGFRERFESGGRLSDYLSAIPVYVIEASNPALRGVVATLDD
ncbi:glucokinase [Salinisphaera sp. USBA-960]|nr:glucokinase [Salifodinibacter halophilus]NNC26968.1 glucokinase [Salifodinibacter halophilus]